MGCKTSLTSKVMLMMITPSINIVLTRSYQNSPTSKSGGMNDNFLLNLKNIDLDIATEMRIWIID